jgi:hypothetical protein
MYDLTPKKFWTTKCKEYSIFCLSIFQHSEFTNNEQGNVLYCGPRCQVGERFWPTIFFEFVRPEMYEGVALEWRVEQKELELCVRTVWFKGCSASVCVCVCEPFLFLWTRLSLCTV